jgi:hypothetical protein
VKIQTKINKTNHQKIPSSSPPIALLSTPKKSNKRKNKKMMNGLRRNRTSLSTTYKEGNPRRRNAETMHPQQTQLMILEQDKANYSKSCRCCSTAEL